MAQTKKEITAALDAAGSRPRHRFGQNFMVEPDLVRVIADAAELADADTAIEVGPGTGTLTEELLERAGRVVAVEIDRDLAAHLRGRFGDRLALIEGDALAGKHALNPELLEQVAEAASPKLVANLPYNIASPLVVELLIAGVETLVFTVQKEVADRLASGPERPGDYGPLSAVVQSLADVEVLRTIPPTAFWPRPKIDSALVRLRRTDRLGSLDARGFSTFVAGVFGQRRKTVRNPLGKLIGPDRLPAVLAAGDLTGGERAEQIDPAALRRMFAASRDPQGT